jgi:hypothetical protein
MKQIRISNLISIFVLGLAILFIGSTQTNAQNGYDTLDRCRSHSRAGRQQADRDFRSQYQELSRRDVSVVVLQGYEYGLQAGRLDRSRGKFNASNVYRNTPSRPYGGDTSSADYLYRQGYLEGYEDGYNGRLRYQ